MSIGIYGPGETIYVGRRPGVRLSAGGGLTFLLRDDFTTPQAAPLTSPRTAEPGPGTLTLVQTDGQFSTSGGKLNFPAQTTPVTGDQGFYASTGLSRLTGRTLMAVVNGSTLPSGGVFVPVWARSQTLDFTSFSGMASGLYWTTNFRVAEAAIGVDTGISPATSTSYSIATVLRATGAFCFIKGGVFTNWTLFWVGNTDSTATVYPAMSNFNAVGTLDTFRVLDLAAPFDTDYGLATQRLAGARTAGDTFTHEADCVIEHMVTTLSSGTGISFHVRRQDSSNLWSAYVSSSGAFGLTEVVGGANTNRADVAGVVSAGHRIVIVAVGTTIRGYSNNVLRWTYASASNFATATSGKLDSLGTGGAVSDIVSWPRQLGAAAAALLDSAVA